MFSDTMMLGGSGRKAAFSMQNSLLFRGAQYLSRTPSVAGNRTTWTYSAWVRLTPGGASSPATRSLLSAGSVFGSRFDFDIGETDVKGNADLCIYDATTGVMKYTNAIFRDPTAWQHFLLVWDTANATAADRVRLYVNGVRITDWNMSTDPALNANSAVNSTTIHTIGFRPTNSDSYLKDYLAEPAFIDGMALTPASFGELDSVTLSWRPKKIGGVTWGTNGFHLGNPWNSASLGTDYSGQGNNWTPSGFVSTDVVTDTPTNVFATLNPLDKASNATVQDGNLVFNPGATGDLTVRSTIAIDPSSSEGWYCTVKMLSGSGIMFGLSFAGTALSGNNAPFPSTNYWACASGNKYNGTTPVAVTGLSGVAGDIWMLAIKDGSMYVGKNGTWLNGADPAAGTGAIWTGIPVGTYHIAANSGANTGIPEFNFGQRSWASAPPSGFKALCTANLPAPKITKPSQHMAVVTWTGSGLARSITGVGFKPDFVWIKCRSNAQSHYLFDSVRGAGKYLNTDLTNAETTNAQTVTSFDADGFSLGTANDTNNSGFTYVAWCWKASGAAVSNTDGTIASQISANPAAGFSVVTYTGTGVNGTVGHGLGSVPKFVVVKNRSAALSDWPVYHSTTGAAGCLLLGLTTAYVATADKWNSTSPDSSVFNVGTHAIVNGNGNNLVAYCFSEVSGYSKFGSYMANGSIDGPFVYCGFRPKFVMVKCTSGQSGWFMWDAVRSPHNQVGSTVHANQPFTEATLSGYSVDITGTGFKLRDANEYNISGGSYIFAAFAEFPLGGLGVTPTTAR